MLISINWSALFCRVYTIHSRPYFINDTIWRLHARIQFHTKHIWWANYFTNNQIQRSLCVKHCSYSTCCTKQITGNTHIKVLQLILSIQRFVHKQPCKSCIYNTKITKITQLNKNNTCRISGSNSHELHASLTSYTLSWWCPDFQFQSSTDTSADHQSLRRLVASLSSSRLSMLFTAVPSLPLIVNTTSLSYGLQPSFWWRHHRLHYGICYTSTLPPRRFVYKYLADKRCTPENILPQ